MTSPAHSDLGYCLSKFYFGQEVASVILKLFDYDQLSFQGLITEVPQLKREDLKKALLICVKYQFVDYVKRIKNFRTQYEYTLSFQRLFNFYRIPRFIQMIGTKDGEHKSSILKYIAEKGLVSRETLLNTLVTRISQNVKLEKGVEDGPDHKKNMESELQTLIDNKLVGALGDSLCLNIEKLSRICRDKMIIDTIYKFYHGETKIRQLAEEMLHQTAESTSENATITAPVAISSLGEGLVPKCFNNRASLESYLDRLTSEVNNRFIVSLGIHQGKGHMYAIDLGLVIDYMVKEYISSMITTRFGPRCCRVFRVLLRRGALLLKQIEECVMLPAKDVREYSYMLLKEGLVRNQQVPKTPDLAPSKSLFIMSVELDQVVFQATDHCCRTMSNLLIRYDHELSHNKAILDRSKAVKELLKTEGIAEDSPEAGELWSQYFNSHEMAQLDQVNKNLHKILMAKAQVDEMLFLLHTWAHMRPDLRDDYA